MVFPYYSQGALPYHPGYPAPVPYAQPVGPDPGAVENRHSLATEEWLDGFCKTVTDSCHLDDHRAHKYDNPYGAPAPSPRNLHERSTRASLNKEKVSKREKAAKAAEAKRPGSALRMRVPPEDAPLLPPRNQYAPVNAANAKAKSKGPGSPKRKSATATRSFLHNTGRKGGSTRGGSPSRTRRVSQKSVTVEPEHPHYNKEDPALRAAREAAYAQAAHYAYYNPYGAPTGPHGEPLGLSAYPYAYY